MSVTKWRGCSAIVIGLLALPAVAGMPPAWAVDCKSLSAEIKKERSLIKKKERLAEAVKVCPTSSEINYSYGYALERLRNYEQAVTYYKKAVGLDSRASAALFGLGDVYSILGDNKAAVEAYEKGLRLAPEDRRAKKSLETARKQAGAGTGKPIPEEPPVETPRVASAPVSAKPVPTVQPLAHKVVAEPKSSPSVEKVVPPAVVAAAGQSTIPATEPPGTEKAEDLGNVPAMANKSEKLPVLEPRVVKRPVARQPPVVPQIPPPVETGKPASPESPVVASASAAKPPGQPLAGQTLDIQPGRRIDSRILQFNSRDQVAEFSLALAQEEAGRKRLVPPEMRGGINLAEFKKIQDSRRQEIANTARIDALPVDPERPIIPCFREKRLATPQEPAR